MILACSMLSAIATRRVKPLDGDEGKPRASLEGYTGDVYSIAWSPNGKLLATGSDDRTVKLWDAATGKMLADLPGHTDSICSVAWSPNGKTLASSAGDATLKLWDLDTGKLLSSLRGHTGGVYTVAWSPDGKTLASGSDDRTVKLWMALWARNGFDNTLQSAQSVSSPEAGLLFLGDLPVPTVDVHVYCSYWEVAFFASSGPDAIHPIPAKVLTVAKRSSQYRVLVQIELDKYLGSFHTLRFGEKKLFTGSCHNGQLDLFYYRDPGLKAGKSFPLWTIM